MTALRNQIKTKENDADDDVTIPMQADADSDWILFY